ncbi:hypothetical protein ABW21_db0204301 [Orbilia brochopaga]|nr:hypothetical protein ABW21_db0204301 [Drechslerella brochopaga]
MSKACPAGYPTLPNEILEQVLLEIPAVEVMTTCRAVSKGWKSLIEESPPLARYSTTGISTRYDEKQDDGERFLTPMARKVFSAFWQKLGLRIQAIATEQQLDPVAFAYYCLDPRWPSPDWKLQARLDAYQPITETAKQLEFILNIPITRHSFTDDMLAVSVNSKCFEHPLASLAAAKHTTGKRLNLQATETVTVGRVINALAHLLSRESKRPCKFIQRPLTSEWGIEQTPPRDDDVYAFLLLGPETNSKKHRENKCGTVCNVVSRSRNKFGTPCSRALMKVAHSMDKTDQTLPYNSLVFQLYPLFRNPPSFNLKLQGSGP